MKKALFSLSMLFVCSTAAWAYNANSACDDFIPDDQLDKIPHVERNGTCYIDDSTDITNLRFDKKKTMEMLKKIDPKMNLVPLFIGDSRAMLVNNDTLYALENGNEQWNSQDDVEVARQTNNFARNNAEAIGVGVGVAVTGMRGGNPEAGARAAVATTDTLKSIPSTPPPSPSPAAMPSKK